MNKKYRYPRPLLLGLVSLVAGMAGAEQVTLPRSSIVDHPMTVSFDSTERSDTTSANLWSALSIAGFWVRRGGRK